MISMNTFVADELANKVYHLSQALNQAKTIINTLEIENKNLIDAFNNLASQNKEDYILDSEAWSEHSYAT
jgi:hypothetical protein